jgi:UDP-3-O-[3-hydroxymyristoyl] glucosamine N-acyltransferase
MIAESAQVDSRAQIGESSRVWDLAQVREEAVIGANCVIGRGAYIDRGVTIGDNCKIQNNALIYAPARLGDGVFIGPGAILTNDVYPRAVNPDLTLKSASDWEPTGVTVETGAAIGAGAVVRGAVCIGRWALVAAGAVVVSSVPAHALVAGVPARRIGWVGKAGERLEATEVGWRDPVLGDDYVETEAGLAEAT